MDDFFAGTDDDETFARFLALGFEGLEGQDFMPDSAFAQVPPLEESSDEEDCGINSARKQMRLIAHLRRSPLQRNHRTKNIAESTAPAFLVFCLKSCPILDLQKLFVGCQMTSDLSCGTFKTLK
jgi:hypothetical protein